MQSSYVTPGIPPVCSLVTPGIPPVCSLYRRDSRRYTVYTGGIPAGVQRVSAVLKQSTAAGFPPVYIYYWQDCCLVVLIMGTIAAWLCSLRSGCPFAIVTSFSSPYRFQYPRLRPWPGLTTPSSSRISSKWFDNIQSTLDEYPIYIGYSRPRDHRLWSDNIQSTLDEYPIYIGYSRE